MLEDCKLKCVLKLSLFGKDEIILGFVQPSPGLASTAATITNIN